MSTEFDLGQDAVPEPAIPNPGDGEHAPTCCSCPGPRRRPRRGRRERGPRRAAPGAAGPR